MNESTKHLVSLLPLITMTVFNAAVFGTISVKMARKRGLRPVPAFFAGMFSSFIALFYIAMHPIIENPKTDLE